MHCIGTNKAIELLEHAGILRRYPNLPSWVPGWTVMVREPMTSELYGCADSIAASISFCDSGRKLRVRGVVFDQVLYLDIPITRFPVHVHAPPKCTISL
jgi:hypothetical protein